MAVNKIQRLLVTGLFCLLISCCPSSLPPEQYASWISDPTHGLVQQRQVAVFDMSLQYWTPEFRALRELGGVGTFSQTGFDSLSTANRESLYFIFTLGPTAGKAQGDAMYSGITNFKEYDQRMRNLSFHLSEYWLLRLPDGREFPPVLATMEQTFGIAESRKMHLVFAPPDSTTHFPLVDWWDIEFRDDIFGTGLHHFVYKKEDWGNLPSIKINLS